MEKIKTVPTMTRLLTSQGQTLVATLVGAAVSIVVLAASSEGLVFAFKGSSHVIFDRPKFNLAP